MQGPRRRGLPDQMSARSLWGLSVNRVTVVFHQLRFCGCSLSCAVLNIFPRSRPVSRRGRKNREHDQGWRDRTRQTCGIAPVYNAIDRCSCLEAIFRARFWWNGTSDTQ